MSGLLVGSHSLSVLLSTATIRGELLHFWPVLVSSDVFLSVLRSWAEFSHIELSLPYVIVVNFVVSIPS